MLRLSHQDLLSHVSAASLVSHKTVLLPSHCIKMYVLRFCSAVMLSVALSDCDVASNKVFLTHLSIDF